MSFLDRISAWWSKDKVQRVEEDGQLSEHERELDEQDFEGKKDDVAVSRYYTPPGTDFESDSEPPRY